MGHMKDNLVLDEIPYFRNACELYERVRDLPASCLLDSSFPYSNSGRYDIVTADPMDVTLPALVAGADEDQTRAYFSDLAAWHREFFKDTQPVAHDLPFCGGLLGYLGYEAGKSLHQLPIGLENATELPNAQVAAYGWSIVQDHLLRKTVLVTLPHISTGYRQDLLSRFRQVIPERPDNFRLLSAFQSNMSSQTYREAFDKIQGYIQAGDCYQVNLAQRFEAEFEGDTWLAYKELRAVAAAPFSAFFDLGDSQSLLSVSPERFISLHKHRVETSPIKGTRPRHKDPDTDKAAIKELRASIKDRAENLMIVDLLRNDLGRSCVPGSIHVERLFEIKSFPTVHHMVSTISGELTSDRGPLELLRDSFPGGSIIGAPKKRAMEIIEELEPNNRQAYCGSIFYISSDGRMDSNIAIRTMVAKEGKIYCWAGGGIVADSQWQQEYQETYDKVGQFLKVLEETL
jgi:para-aminobenzoate synthetase component 1